MRHAQRTAGGFALAALAAAALWIVATPAQAQHAVGMTDAVANPTAPEEAVALPGACGTADDTLFGKSIKDPSCKKPCKPFVKTKSGLTCVFVGCFDETGECAYRC